jgi:ethanolamine utilization protein EutJ
VSDGLVTALLGRAAGLLAAGTTATGDATAAAGGHLASPGELRAGVDLGTASCVLVVLDRTGQPVHVASYPSGALRDGVVVDFATAAKTIRRLREEAERTLGTTLTSAATAYPPCIAEPDARACRFVCEAAGFDKVIRTDEVTAAQHSLGVQDGVIVDVGGGSTGVGVFRSGRLVALADRPGGGHHLDLVLAGALGIDTEEAERRKREDSRGSLPHLLPGLERIAESVRLMTTEAEDLPLHLAGGALMIPGAAEIIGQYLGRETVSYPHALLITPLGIARCAP